MDIAYNIMVLHSYWNVWEIVFQWIIESQI